MRLSLLDEIERQRAAMRRLQREREGLGRLVLPEEMGCSARSSRAALHRHVGVPHRALEHLVGAAEDLCRLPLPYGEVSRARNLLYRTRTEWRSRIKRPLLQPVV